MKIYLYWSRGPALAKVCGSSRGFPNTSHSDSPLNPEPGPLSPKHKHIRCKWNYNIFSTGWCGGKSWNPSGIIAISGPIRKDSCVISRKGNEQKMDTDSNKSTSEWETDKLPSGLDCRAPTAKIFTEGELGHGERRHENLHPVQDKQSTSGTYLWTF